MVAVFKFHSRSELVGTSLIDSSNKAANQNYKPLSGSTESVCKISLGETSEEISQTAGSRRRFQRSV